MNNKIINFNEVLPTSFNKVQHIYFRKLEKLFTKITERSTAVVIIAELLTLLKLVKLQVDSVIIIIIMSSLSILSLVAIGFVLPVIKYYIEDYIVKHPEKYYDKDVTYEVQCYSNGKDIETLYVQETSNNHYYIEYASKMLIPRALILKDLNGTYIINECALSNLHTIAAYIAVKCRNSVALKYIENRRPVSDYEKKVYIDQIVHEFDSKKRFGKYLRRKYKLSA